MHSSLHDDMSVTKDHPFSKELYPEKRSDYRRLPSACGKTKRRVWAHRTAAPTGMPRAKCSAEPAGDSRIRRAMLPCSAVRSRKQPPIRQINSVRIGASASTRPARDVMRTISSTNAEMLRLSRHAAASSVPRGMPPGKKKQSASTIPKTVSAHRSVRYVRRNEWRSDSILRATLLASRRPV